ncbi:FKBP-type peptidyl-prolyl cis-trans isomerase [Gayadomonas joobiniege]|uniref:FKBP-type peptidyl-prolyl cis-trans isomerase n=1 Tax=Gayadomonas joobiniege TaxID=1234606 RepID=UPI00036BC36A|nr:FKBP-type peptidyl-prolyl cis-trans isomerase [Gayadomonas joobiniege]
MAKGKNKKINKGSTGANRKNSAAFVEKYQQKTEVQVLASGLMYRVIDQAKAPVLKPTIYDTVKVHQRILLTDGSCIADTYKAGLADEFTMAEAIEGLREGLLQMGIGDRFEFVIPADLAWGKKGNGSKIGPNAVMIMDVRLLEII